MMTLVGVRPLSAPRTRASLVAQFVISRQTRVIKYRCVAEQLCMPCPHQCIIVAAWSHLPWSTFDEPSCYYGEWTVGTPPHFIPTDYPLPSLQPHIPRIIPIPQPGSLGLSRLVKKLIIVVYHNISNLVLNCWHWSQWLVPPFYNSVSKNIFTVPRARNFN